MRRPSSRRTRSPASARAIGPRARRAAIAVLLATAAFEIAAAAEPEPGAEPAAEERATEADEALDRALRSTRETLGRADRAAALVRELETAPEAPALLAAEPELRQRGDRAGERLEAGRARLEQAERAGDLVGIEEALGLAAQALQEFEDLGTTIAGRLAELRAAARADEERRIAEQRRRERERQEQQRREAIRSEPPAPAAEPAAGSTAAASRPPAMLLAAARAYFAGEYRQVLVLLAEPEFTDPKAMLQGRLLRAAAGHALYLLGREQDLDLLRRAREDAAACRRLDARFEPDPGAFSPRFLAFYRGS